jgi:predicted dehydrogenase
METIGIALIGSGYIAHYHARGLQEQAGVRIQALCSLDGPDAQVFADKYGIPEVTDIIQGLLGRTDIQAVIICTPNSFHAPYALDFMKHGQDVFVEKPMAVNAVQGQEMGRCARDRQRVLMVGHMWRFDTEVDYVRDLVQTGQLGEIVKTKGYGIHVNWGPEGWFVQKALAGGGALADMGVHAIDAVRYILGDPRPTRVYAQISTAFGDYDVDDTGILVITWETGTVSVIESGWWHTHADGPEAGTQVFGTAGYASCFPTLYKWKQGDKMEESVPDMPKRQEHCDQVIYSRQMEHFVQCLRTRQEPVPGPDHGQVVLQIVDAAYQSAQTGLVVDIARP